MTKKTVFKSTNYDSLKPLNCLQFLLVDAKNRTNLKMAELFCPHGMRINHHLSVVVTIHVSPHIPDNTHDGVRNVSLSYNTKVNLVSIAYSILKELNKIKDY